MQPTLASILRPPCVYAPTACSPSLSKEIEDALGPELFGVYSRNLRVKVATDGRGAACTGTSVPALPRPPLTPGRPLEKSGTLKRRPASSSDAPADPAGAREIETHQVTWTSCGPIPSHSYVEAERIDSLDEWFARCDARRGAAPRRTRRAALIERCVRSSSRTRAGRRQVWASRRSARAARAHKVDSLTQANRRREKQRGCDEAREHDTVTTSDFSTISVFPTPPPPPPPPPPPATGTEDLLSPHSRGRAPQADRSVRAPAHGVRPARVGVGVRHSAAWRRHAAPSPRARSRRCPPW